jgi:hypothetical protein
LQQSRPERSRTQAALHLGQELKLLPAKAKLQPGIRAQISRLALKPGERNIQPLRLRGGEGIVQKGIFRGIVHDFAVSTFCEQASIVNRLSAGFKLYPT